MTDFNVVVLPAPLRPSNVTTSPADTSNVAPWSTCDSPYQACSPSTASKGAPFGLSMPSSEVCLAYERVGGNRLVIAFGQHSAAREHRDLVERLGAPVEFFFNHHHRAVGGDRFDECADTIDFFVPHPAHWFVQQQLFRLERQGGSDLQGALAALWQFNR